MKFKSAVIGLAAFSALASLSSCKPVRSEQGAITEPLVSDLKISFYVSDSKSTVPNFDHPVLARLMDGAIREGQVLQLKKRIAIPSSGASEGKLFLALSDSIGIRRITDASYEHRSVSSTNAAQGDGHRELLSYDRDQHQFFLPLDESTLGQSESLSSLDLQTLDLSLSLEDGSTSHFEIRFYVNPPMPSAEQIRISQVFNEPRVIQEERTPKITAKLAATKEGWVVLTERYTNPTLRPLFLWFSSAGLSYQLETELGVKLSWGDIVPTYRPAMDDGFEPDFHRFSRVPLKRVSLVFKNLKDMEIKTLSLTPAVTRPVEIRPGQTFDVEWKVLAASEPSFCHPGELISRTLWGCDTQVASESLSRKPWPACARPQGEWAIFKDPFVLNGSWEVKQLRVVGEFKNTVQVTEELGTHPQALAQAIDEGLALSIASSKALSDMNPNAEMYSCQGIF